MLLDAIDDCTDALAIGAASGIEGIGAACGAGHEKWRLCWYGDLIASHFELSLKAARGQDGGIALGAISLPPREGKSWRAAFLSARALGLDPHLQVMWGAYGRELAVQNLARTRAVMSSPAYLAAYRTRLGSTAELEPKRKRGDRPRKVRAEERSQIFRTLYPTAEGSMGQADGYFLSTSLAAGATGWGYHLGIVDDLVKDAPNATPGALAKQLDWYRKVFLTRGHKERSAIVLIGTRWSPDDVIGKEVERWRREGRAHYAIELPALRDAPDPTGLDPRELGEWLDPPNADRYEFVRSALADDPQAWEALYQQRPVRDGGNILRREDFGRYDPADLARTDFEQVFTSWDPAQKATGKSRYAGGVWGAFRGRLFCLERRTGHYDYDEWEREVAAMIKRWPAATVHVVEDTAAGAILHQRKIREIAGLVKAEHPVKDKVTRTTAQLPHYRGRRVLLPSRTYGAIDAGWVEPFLIEAARFPGEPNDQVDECTQAIAWAHSRGLLR